MTDSSFSTTSTTSPRWIRPGIAAGRYEQALRALCENDIREYAAGIAGETDEYLRANDAVADAKSGVPGWRRWLITRRVVRELDYWARTGQVSK